MTSEERADKLVSRFTCDCFDRDFAVKKIVAAIRAAVADEREACIEMTERLQTSMDEWLDAQTPGPYQAGMEVGAVGALTALAAAIRARTKVI